MNFKLKLWIQFFAISIAVSIVLNFTSYLLLDMILSYQESQIKPQWLTWVEPFANVYLILFNLPYYILSDGKSIIKMGLEIMQYYFVFNSIVYGLVIAWFSNFIQLQNKIHQSQKNKPQKPIRKSLE